MDSGPASAEDYNETLRKISNSLQNALDTFGSASRQYQTILEILKDCLKEIDEKKMITRDREVVDPDMLTAAMGFLTI